MSGHHTDSLNRQLAFFSYGLCLLSVKSISGLCLSLDVSREIQNNYYLTIGFYNFVVVVHRDSHLLIGGKYRENMV